MSDNTLTLAIVGHLIGDYLLQNDWMAMNKKHHSWICIVHCLIWATAVCIFAGWFSLLAWAVLFVTHFAQDRTNFILGWMHLIGQRQFASGACAPWSVIVVDNVWHVLTIVAVWKVIQPMTS